MVTTHSPVFIDFSRDNTTIVRVERQENGTIQGTTVFRPEKAQLSDDDKQNKGPFFGDSHTSPTPANFTIQKLGLGITKAFALHMKRDSKESSSNAYT
jgi:hypothetical protein